MSVSVAYPPFRPVWPIECHNAAIVNTYAVGAKNRVNSKNNVQLQYYCDSYMQMTEDPSYIAAPDCSTGNSSKHTSLHVSHFAI